MGSLGGATGLTWLAADHLNSTSLTINPLDYTQYAEIRYAPWGETRYTTPNATIPTDRRYTGQREESDLDLYYYNARWYDPALSHFIMADTIIPGADNPQAWDRYAYTLNNPIRYNDPSGHLACGDGIDDDRCNQFDPEEEVTLPPVDPSNSQDYNGWDLVPVVSDVREIIRGSQETAWAYNEPVFMYEQEVLQSWYDNCYGLCHYADFIEPSGLQSTMGGPMPSTPVVDIYSEGMGDIVSGLVNISMTATSVKISRVQGFAKGGKAWHLGLETNKNMNIIHIGNHPNFGVHIAFGSVKPFVANLHIYIKVTPPFFRAWKPK